MIMNQRQAINFYIDINNSTIFFNQHQQNISNDGLCLAQIITFIVLFIKGIVQKPQQTWPQNYNHINKWPRQNNYKTLTHSPNHKIETTFLPFKIQMDQPKRSCVDCDFHKVDCNYECFCYPLKEARCTVTFTIILAQTFKNVTSYAEIKPAERKRFINALWFQCRNEDKIPTGSLKFNLIHRDLVVSQDELRKLEKEVTFYGYDPGNNVFFSSSSKLINLIVKILF